MARPRLWPWLLFASLWIAGVAYIALHSWPTLPLDMPARDPQVQAAFARAVQAHVIRYTLVALGPVALLLATVAWRRSKSPPP